MAEIQVTTREAATACGISLRTAQRWAAKGKLTAVKTSGRWVITLPAPELDGVKPATVDKARDLIEAGAIFATNRPGIFTAVSSDGSTTYLVHTVTCTCPAGIKGRTCYHRAAAAILAEQRKQELAAKDAIEALDTEKRVDLFLGLLEELPIEARHRIAEKLVELGGGLL